jgi:hypothetical protein
MERPLVLSKSLTFLILGVAASLPAMATNLLENPGFDRNLAGWTVVPVGVWAGLDGEGSPTSGSARLTNNFAGVGFQSGQIGQCVAVDGGRDYSMAALARVVSGQARTGLVYLVFRYYSVPGCDEDHLIDGSSFYSTTVVGSWQTISGTWPLPPAARSLQLTVALEKNEAGGTFAANVDQVSLCAVDDCLPNTDPCLRDGTTACLLAGRFEVRVTWGAFDGGSGVGHVMSFAGARAESDQSAFFWFFNPANFEMGVKAVDACGPYDRFWVFVSGLTNVRFEVEVRDTHSGAVKRYSNPLGVLPTTRGDTSAFACP